MFKTLCKDHLNITHMGMTQQISQQLVILYLCHTVRVCVCVCVFSHSHPYWVPTPVLCIPDQHYWGLAPYWGLIPSVLGLALSSAQILLS